MVKKIKHFMLPEQTNQLYKNEAISSISLTRDVADKINELVDAYNELSQLRLDKIHEQDGKIAKAVLFMKDNLLNTIDYLLNLKGAELIDNAVEKHIDILIERVNNLLGSVVEGSTTLDAELIDVRIGSDGVVYANAGESIRTQIKELKNVFNNGGITLTKLDFEQGNYQGGVKATEKKRLRTRKLIKVKQGDAITFNKLNGLYGLVGVIENEDSTEHVQSSHWIGEDGTTFIVGYDGFAYITIGNAKDFDSSTNITLDDFHCEIIQHTNENYRRSMTLKRVNECELIFTDDGYPTFEYTGTSTRIKFDGEQVYLICANGKRITIKFEDIVNQEDIKDYVSLNTNEDGTIKGIVFDIPYQIGWFGVDAFTGEFKFSDRFTSTDISFNICILLYFYYGNLNGKLINRYTYKSNLTKVEKTEFNKLAQTSKGYMYISQGANIDISSYGSNGGLQVVIDSTLNGRFYTKMKHYLWEDISTNIANRITIEDKKATIVIPNFSNILVFNISDEQLYIRTNIDNVKNDDYVLLSNGWSNACDGLLYDEWRKSIDKAHELAIAKLQDTNAKEVDSAKIKEFAKLFNNSDYVDSFLFFTDPHLCEGSENWETNFYKYLSYIKTCYEQTPTNAIICGGDWLGNSDTQSQACYKLGFIDGYMKKNFKNYYHVVGNHDTNYQGVKDDDSTAWSGRLSNKTINNLWFEGKISKAVDYYPISTYYSFMTNNTKYIVLDCGIENDNLSDSHFTNQLEWLCMELNATDLTNNLRTNVVVIMHMYEYDTNGNVQAFANEVAQICMLNNHGGMYNNDEHSLSINLSNEKCVVRYILTGHLHQDKITYIEETTQNPSDNYNEITLKLPIIATTQLKQDSIPTFELILNDYTNLKANFIRVGSGESREIEMCKNRHGY